MLIQATAKAGDVEGDDVFVRVPAINLDADTGFVPEGDDIPEADPDLSELVIATGKIAVLVRISREQLAQPSVKDVVTAEVKRSIQRKVNWALLQQPAPVSPAVFPPAGLISHAVAAVDEIEDNLDPVIDVVAGIEALGRSCTHIIAAPDAWASIAKLKDEDTSNRSLIGAGVESAQRTLLSIPVLVTSAMPAGKLLAVDKSKTLSAYGSIQLALSTELFKSDSVAGRATLRFGSGFTEAGAGVVITVADESQLNT